MKKFLRSIVFHVFALWLTSTLITSLSISGNAWGMLSAGFMLTVMMVLLKPLVSLIFLPINILTLGLLSWFVNVVVLYLWTLFVPNVSLVPWVFPGLNVGGFIMPSAQLSMPWTLVIVSLVIMFIVSALERLDDH
ncbi:MAG: phage holin family protein [Candidatus Gottesmanbacteria bacterium]|nr:phage holin family protein [Candidatus Gottesmanbacteria bacterium]